MLGLVVAVIIVADADGAVVYLFIGF